MDEEKRQINETMFSEPDQNGVRFYSMDAKKTLDKKSRTKKALIIFGIVVLVFVILGVACSRLDIDSSSSSSSGNVYPDDSYIAKLSVEGTISSDNASDYFGTPVGYQHQWTLDTIDDLINDENNKGIILFVNSPGGGVYESDELYFKIREYQEQTGRPVYSSMGTMAASGGYYISAPCNKIIANRNCWTGSIGVTMGTLFDFSELLERYGVKTNTITSGANKAMGSSVESMTEEQKQIFQSLVDEAYEQFVGLVAEGRHMDIAKVRQIADGRIYTAKQALSLGLIDKIGTFDEAAADMKKTYKLEDCEVADLSYQDVSFFGSLFGKANFPKMASKGDVAAILELVEQENQFPVSYMCEALK
ncbi:signal peptide peptidase SppA [Aminipila sp.]|uniref:signal peptide peptidase SppA n=1 Tax=Aminipila sp. TaxID=2060095 RepID=UPI0028966DC8|nr:signal peptide peptidase SppA [Aminipila sp.]